MIIAQKIIHLIHWIFNPDLIIVVGENRKLAKEAIFSVLKKIKPAKKSKTDINKSIFSFLFCFGKKILIGEYATDVSGESKNLLEFIQPRIVVVADSQNEDIKEKSRLAENLSTSDFIIVNFDDQEAMAIKEKTRAKIITFGFGNEENEGKPDLKIMNFEEKQENGKISGIVLKLEYGGSFVPITIDKVSGKNYAYAAAVGVILGIMYDLNLVEAAEQIDGAFV
ncbi:hypothetical protein HZC33_03305 [Candidatus Wolfebacteria bacterium]|nr:hypothetical protein [Candidatus Wolfebacteria bacterium]